MPLSSSVFDVGAQAAGERVVAAGVVEGVAGDFQELRALRVAEGMQVRPRQDLPRLLLGELGRRRGRQHDHEQRSHRRGT